MSRMCSSLMSSLLCLSCPLCVQFNGSVCDIPFNDHNAPAFSLLMMFCRDAHTFLSANPENVIAVVR
jgi:hypothetical protein